MMPFKHLSIKVRGFAAACWRNFSRLGDFQKKSIYEIWHGEEINELRKQLLNNEMPNECHACWDVEKCGAKSTRLTEINDDQEFYKKFLQEDFKIEKYPESLDINFGTTCNLACRHCSPDSSSVWAKIVKENEELKDLHETFSRDGVKLLSDNFINEIKDIAPYLKRVIISGGEPLIQKQHYDCLENLMDYAHNIEISYNTNLSQITFGNVSVIDLWPKFKKVYIRISLDSDKKNYSYVRHGGDYSIVEKNIKTLINSFRGMENIVLSATNTISILNITRLEYFLEEVFELGLLYHSSFVTSPVPLSIQNLPKKIKVDVEDYILNFLKEIKNEDHHFWKKHENWKSENNKSRQLQRLERFLVDTINYMQGGEIFNELPNHTKHYLTVLDRVHGGNWKTVYPELNRSYEEI